MNPRGRSVHHRRCENIPPDEELRRHVARHWIVRVVHQERAGDGHAGERRLAHERPAVGRQASVQSRERA